MSECFENPRHEMKQQTDSSMPHVKANGTCHNGITEKTKNLQNWQTDPISFENKLYERRIKR